MSDDLRQLLAATNSGTNFVAVAKLLSAVERAGAKIFEIPELREPKNMAFRIGITGPPGAGKSTLIGRLLERFKKENKRVGVLAIDPTSPISHGAVLGDRIRYTQLLNDQNIFVRSLGTRGSLGGLAAQAYLMARVFDACQFDVAIIETVGVGQTELDVMNVADTVVLVLVPESGDSIQVLKAGVIEIADAIVVNKSDRPGAEALRYEIESQLASSEKRNPATVLTLSAAQDQGIDLLLDWFNKESTKPWREKRNTPNRLRAEAVALKRDQIETHLHNLVYQIDTPEQLNDFFKK